MEAEVEAAFQQGLQAAYQRGFAAGKQAALAAAKSPPEVSTANANPEKDEAGSDGIAHESQSHPAKRQVQLHDRYSAEVEGTRYYFTTPVHQEVLTSIDTDALREAITQRKVGLKPQATATLVFSRLDSQPVDHTAANTPWRSCH